MAPERIAEVRTKLVKARDDAKAASEQGDALALLYLQRHDEATRLLARLDARDPELLAQIERGPRGA